MLEDKNIPYLILNKRMNLFKDVWINYYNLVLEFQKEEKKMNMFIECRTLTNISSDVVPFSRASIYSG